MTDSLSHIKRHLDHFKTVCRTAGVKCTRQRLTIYTELIRNPNHPDAETVYNQVRHRLKNISLDTVYRTLWLLKDLKLIATLGPPRERSRFDANLAPHHHFFCERCGLIADFHHNTLNHHDIAQYVKDLGHAKSFQINIKGTCSRCLDQDLQLKNPRPEETHDGPPQM
ncbi:MAG: transcriptional repressor [Desulfobacteraceae bacterium]|nr:MAG: transcriptional repressor [Desulfobacteraceae bacterium]